MEDLFRLTAREVVDGLRRGDIKPEEALDASCKRIEAVDGALNALPTLCVERAYDAAKNLKPSDHVGRLAGLPIVVKDLTEVKGVRTTFGSTLFADHVPTRSDPLVERLEGRGAVVLAKSNTPEFGAGANTFNEVFGKTVNPWDTTKTCGGSSGGSAVALASGQAWLATGSDLGGSLRTPAAFCSVVGLRPSLGRVPRAPNPAFCETLWTEGPMARNVGDVGLLLDSMSGEDMRVPLSLPEPATPFRISAESPCAPKRVAFSRNLGVVPVQRETADICEQAALRLQDLGCEVDEACIDFTGAREIFQTLRAAGFATRFAPMLKTRRDDLKPEVVWNIEKGLALTAEEIGQAERGRAKLFERTLKFFETYDVLVCPTATVAPFDVNIRYIDTIEGEKLDTYIDWIAITFVVTLTGCPVVSLPCGFTKDGLPVGMQMIGKPKEDAALLSQAAAAEALFDIAKLVPLDPVTK